MNQIKVILMACFTLVMMSQTANAQDKKQNGIEFETGTWAEVLAKAKAEDKPIFLDGYASWCGPCKRMIKTVFTDGGVGRYYNENFINYKLDMEKGEGPALARKYKVKSYPTFLFFNSDGELVHRSLGYQEPSKFLVTAKDATDPDKSLVSLATRYEAGERDQEFLKNYSVALRNASMPYSGVAQEYIEKLDEKELETKDAREFVFSFADKIESQSFAILMDNKEAFIDQFGAEKVNRKIQRCALKSVGAAAVSNDDNKMSDIKKILKKNGGDNSKAMINQAYMAYHKLRQEWNDYSKYAIKFVDSSKEPGASTLNNIAWDFYEHVDDKKALMQATDWAKRSVDIDCQYYNCDTYAALLYKTAQYEKAKDAAEKAIQQAMKSGDSYGETQRLLDKINEKLSS